MKPTDEDRKHDTGAPRGKGCGEGATSAMERMIQIRQAVQSQDLSQPGPEDAGEPEHKPG